MDPQPGILKDLALDQIIAKQDQQLRGKPNKLLHKGVFVVHPGDVHEEGLGTRNIIHIISRDYSCEFFIFYLFQ